MRGTTLNTAVNPSVRTSPLTPGTPPSVEDLVTALLHNVPFLAAAPAVATDEKSVAWLAAAGWPMTPSTNATDGVW